MSEQKTNEAAAFVISPKMARALSDTWRSRILMELSVRPLSPSQFVERFGGDLSHISRCFRQLAEWDYIEIAETQTGGRRRGGIEHIYRSVHRAHIDTSTWEQLPRANRDQFSISIIESYLARIQEALEAGTFDEEDDRHLSWDPLVLDEAGTKELGARLDSVLDWLPVLGVESAKRMAASGEEPIPTTVGLNAFRSPPELGALPPRPTEQPVGPAEATPFAISAKMAKAMANKWRSRILMELRARPMSPTEFVNDIGGGRRNITRCFSQLAEWDYIEVVETRSGGARRGGQEKFYRLKERVHFDNETWRELPRFLRDEFSVSILQSYFTRVTEAIEAGTFEADIHLSWDGIALDRQAWTELIARVDGVFYWLSTLADKASRRLEESGEEGTTVTVGLAVFRSPKSSAITPRNTIES